MASIPVIVKLGEQTWQAAWHEELPFDTDEFLEIPICQICEQRLLEDAWIITEPGHSTGFMCGACATYVFAGQPGRSPEDRWRHVG